MLFSRLLTQVLQEKPAASILNILNHAPAIFISSKWSNRNFSVAGSIFTTAYLQDDKD